MTVHGQIKAGGKVTEPGVYDLPISEYHSQCCDGPSISSSGIRAILKSPAHYWKHSDLNPNRVEQDDAEAFILGRAAHHLLLGEADFAKHFVIRPDTAPDGRVWNSNNKSCREWLDEQAARGITVLTPAQIEKIKGMAGLLPWQKGMDGCGLANSPLVAHAGVLSGEIEKSLFWREGKVWVKARPDAIPGDSNDFADLKTISPRNAEGMSDRNIAMAVHDHGYHVQGAVVGMAAHRVLGRKMEGFHLVFVDTGNVHAVAVKTLDEADIVLGERAVHVALQIFERCLETGIWPGPTARQADAMRLSIPQWGRDAAERYLDTLEQEFAA